jgi:hypothetical protein
VRRRRRRPLLATDEQSEFLSQRLTSIRASLPRPSGPGENSPHFTEGFSKEKPDRIS